jgi:PQQ-dependent dehydrogenase (s-GDH family)
MYRFPRRPAALLLTLSLLPLPAQDGPESVLRPTKRFTKRTVITGLDHPWEITWGPDNHLWVTERSGKRISRVHPETGQKTVAVTIDEVSAPGGQDGLLGLALHPGLLKGKGNDFVYAAYTYQDKSKAPDLRVADPASPYRQLYGKIVRFRYDEKTQTLVERRDLVTGLPAGNDHNAGRLKVGPDLKLYYAIGDQGNNQLGNFCHAVLAQRLPTAKEIGARDYAAYEGKVMRFNLDGSIPSDNPRLNGVVSHVWSYGHRNTQGLDFGPTGALYGAEHGPKTDDEIDVIVKGGNYGWPHVAGFRDDKAYEYARWAEATTPCSQLRFSDLAIHPSVPREAETAYKKPFIEPIATLFTVPTGYNFANPACAGVDYICWPTVGISGVEYYGGFSGGVPGWDRVLLITTLKRGSLYVLPLTSDGQRAAGKMTRFFRSQNRYRDTAISPDGRTIFIATDSAGLAESTSGGVTTNMLDRGSILAFTYAGEGAEDIAPTTVSQVTDLATEIPAREKKPGDIPPSFTTAQVVAGRKAYEGYCAVCHGSTLANGTFGTPLAGAYFKKAWTHKQVSAFYEKSRTMPPAAPKSLPAETYANIVAYILDFNGFKSGEAPLPAGGDSLTRMWIE